MATARSLPIVTAALALALLAGACSAPQAVPDKKDEGPPPRRPDNPGALFVYAWGRAHAGEKDAALEVLKQLDGAGWNVPVDPVDFPDLAEDPEFKGIVQRTAEREPKTANAAVAFTVKEPGLVAMGMAADPAGNLYVSSLAKRKVVRITPSGEVSDFVKTAAGGLLAPTGLAVETGRNTLWVAANATPAMVDYAPELKGQSGIFGFDLRTGEPRGKTLFGGGEHYLTDLAVTIDGTVYASDSGDGAVYRTRFGSNKFEPFSPPGRYVYPQGIVVAGQRLLVAHAFGIDVIPLIRGAAQPLLGPVDFPLGGISGLALGDRTLVGLQTGLGKPRLVRITLSATDSAAQVEVLETRNSRWRVPSACEFVGRDLFYIANSHADAVLEDKVGDEAMVDTYVMQLRAAPEPAPKKK